MPDVFDNIFDVIIVGSGPAGMSAAMELKKKDPSVSILILEKGPVRKPEDKFKKGYSTCGWGGAGAFSDGKLNLTWKSGGQLINLLSQKEFEKIMKDVSDAYNDIGKACGDFKDPKEEKVRSLKVEALSAGFKDFVYYPTLHWGTDNAYKIVENIRQWLCLQGVNIRCETNVSGVDYVDSVFCVKAKDGHIFRGKNCILAGGRGSNKQTSQIASNFDLEVVENGVDIGVRIEVLAEAFEKFTDLVQSPKLVYTSHRNGKEVRTFCVCPYGFVRLESSYGILTVNGESYSNASGVRSPNTNFALLVHEEFTEPFKDSIGYGNKIASLANDLGKTVIVQTWRDFLKGRRSTPKRISESTVVPTLKEATPGSIGSVLPYDFMVAIEEFIEGPLRKVAPAMNPDTILVYGGEVKQYAKRVVVDKNCQSAVAGLYFIGDGGGYTRGIMQASMQGIIAARHILK